MSGRYSPRHRAPYSELVELAGAGMTPATCHRARHARGIR